jgi:hypothetical protein
VALADDGLAELSVDPGDARMRHLRARDTAGLLEKLEQSASMRRTQRLTWDVGARDTADALARWREAANALGAPYAVGGVDLDAAVGQTAIHDLGAYLETSGSVRIGDDSSSISKRSRPARCGPARTPDPPPAAHRMPEPDPLSLGQSAVGEPNAHVGPTAEAVAVMTGGVR